MDLHLDQRKKLKKVEVEVEDLDLHRQSSRVPVAYQMEVVRLDPRLRALQVAERIREITRCVRTLSVLRQERAVMMIVTVQKQREKAALDYGCLVVFVIRTRVPVGGIARCMRPITIIFNTMMSLVQVIAKVIRCFGHIIIVLVVNMFLRFVRGLIQFTAMGRRRVTSNRFWKNNQTEGVIGQLCHMNHQVVLVTVPYVFVSAGQMIVVSLVIVRVLLIVVMMVLLEPFIVEQTALTASMTLLNIK